MMQGNGKWPNCDNARAGAPAPVAQSWGEFQQPRAWHRPSSALKSSIIASGAGTARWSSRAGTAPPKLPFSHRLVFSAAVVYHLGSCEKTACAAYVRLAQLRRH